jgi:hypothetical protein
MRFWRKRKVRGQLTPDELAALGRPLMIARDLRRIAVMAPDVLDEAVREVGLEDLEALYAAVKRVWMTRSAC